MYRRASKRFASASAGARSASAHRNAGFTLIEALIAILVFSVGLMGMAGLMVVSVKTNHSSYLRTQASFLGQSMADRIRSNRAEINAYNGNYSAATVGSDPCLNGVVCTAENLVVRDRALWSQQLVDLLPNGRATIDCVGNPMGEARHRGSDPFSGRCEMTITWSEASLQRGTDIAPGNPAPDDMTFAWVFLP